MHSRLKLACVVAHPDDETLALGETIAKVDQSDGRDIIRKLVRLLRELRPQVVVTFGPEGLYGHPDHIAISQWTTSALVGAGDARYPGAEELEPQRLETNLAPIVKVNEQWGYSQGGRVAALRSLVAEVLLLNGSPNIREITHSFLQQLYEAMETVVPGQAMIYRLSRILVSLKILEHPLALRGGLPAEKYKLERERGISPVNWLPRLLLQ